MAPLLNTGRFSFQSTRTRISSALLAGVGLYLLSYNFCGQAFIPASLHVRHSTVPEVPVTSTIALLLAGWSQPASAATDTLGESSLAPMVLGLIGLLVLLSRGRSTQAKTLGETDTQQRRQLLVPLTFTTVLPAASCLAEEPLTTSAEDRKAKAEKERQEKLAAKKAKEEADKKAREEKLAEIKAKKSAETKAKQEKIAAEKKAKEEKDAEAKAKREAEAEAKKSKSSDDKKAKEEAEKKKKEEADKKKREEAQRNSGGDGESPFEGLGVFGLGFAALLATGGKKKDSPDGSKPDAPKEEAKEEVKKADA